MTKEIAGRQKGIEYRNFNSKAVKRGLIATVTALSLALTSVTGLINNPSEVEAKKKNHKPRLKFKGQLKNKKITIEEGQEIKLNVTAKDKEDGNITKKIKAKVKKPEDGEYQRNGKYIKFINDGTYKVTISVKDRKNAKTSETRTIVVKEAMDTQLPYLLETPVPTSKPSVSPVPTIEPTKEPLSTLAPTETPKVTSTPEPTETPKETQQPVSSENPTPSTKPTVSPAFTIAPTETPKVTPTPVPTDNKNVTPTDFSKYEINEMNIDGKAYKVTNDSNFEEIVLNSPNDSNQVKLNIQYDYSFMIDDENQMITNLEFIKFLGDISAYDSEGNDISENIIISYSTLNHIYSSGSYLIYFYVEDSKGNSVKKHIMLTIFKKDNGTIYDENTYNPYVLLDSDNLIYGRLESNILKNSSKKMKLKQ